MPRSILLGQIWQKNDTGDKYLITKTYKEVFSTVALLRKVGDETGEGIRVKVQPAGDGVSLPGFTFTQEQ